MKQIDETWMRFLPIAFSVLKLLRIPGNNYTCMTFNGGLVILNNQLENKKHGYWEWNRTDTNARMNFVIMYGNFITGNLWSYPWINYFGNVCTLVLYFDMLFTLLHVWLHIYCRIDRVIYLQNVYKSKWVFVAPNVCDV